MGTLKPTEKRAQRNAAVDTERNTGSTTYFTGDFDCKTIEVKDGKGKRISEKITFD